VTIRYLDRKQKKQKYKQLKGNQFIRLFAEHILPKGFVKIRHFGFLSSRTKAKDLSVIRASLNTEAPPPKVKMTTKEFIVMTTGKNPHQCPVCKKSEMVITKVMHPIRGSPDKIFPRPLPKDRIICIL